MAAPPAKKAKTDNTLKEEVEQDQKRDSTPKISQKAAFLTADTTLNVLPSTVGNMLSSMSEGGLSSLVAGARANIGVSSGRHMFEVKIVESTASKGRAMVRVGFTADSLYLGEDESSICFENDGFLVSDKKRTKCGAFFNTDQIVAVVLNRDASSENNNTISFFKDGVRVSDPQPLPEGLQDKTLFPAVSFKNATVHTNFSTPAVPLPFKCKTIQEANNKEATVTKYDAPSDGKYTALFPVSLPDEGTFDWLDSFLEKNPSYTELSDRAFAEWAMKSGLQANKKKTSNDKADMGFGHGLDDFKALKKSLLQVASLQPRDFVIMEVTGNLVKEDRAKLMEPFKQPSFKNVAEVVVGEPPSSFKRVAQSKILEAKQAAADKEHKIKYAGEKREWIVRKKQKEIEKTKKKREKELKKKAAEAKQKSEAMLKKRQHEMAVRKAKAEGKPAPDEPVEEKPVEVESEEEPEEPEEPEPAEGTPPRVTLSAEEKNLRFAKHDIPDLTQTVFNTTFEKFSLPAKDEGFDTIKYSWSKDTAAASYVKGWVSDKKQTTRVETISPGADFKKKWATWQTTLTSWKAKQNESKNAIAKKAQDKAARANKRNLIEKKIKEEEEKAAKAKEEGKTYEKKEMPAMPESEDEAEPAVDFDGMDVFGVEDILDVGNKIPLFKEFGSEDFTMMALRLELSLLVQSFATDCEDPDRKGIHVDHLAFYYQKYFGKPLNLQAFGVQTVEELAELIDDTVMISKSSVIESLIPGSLETNAVFVKLTEDARRLRNVKVDMGDETAKLKIKGAGGNHNHNNHDHADNNHGQKRHADGANKAKGWGGKGGWGGAWKAW